MDWIKVDKKQFMKEIKERNTYKVLLDKCLFVLNNLPKQKIVGKGIKDTYALAVKIEQVFKENDTLAVRIE